MSKWKKMTIGDFITLRRGHDLTNENRAIGNVPVYGAAGKNGYHNKSLANGPGLIIGRSGGAFGKVYFVKENYWPHNTSLYVTDFKENDPRFAFYLLKLMDLSSLNSGSAQPSLNRNYIYPLPIEVPEPYQQRKIASVLSVLDDKIELNNQINIELEQMAKTLYDYWFVQFDFPDTKGKPYKSSGGKMIFDEALKREIPEGWGVKTLSEINSVLVRGISPKYVENDGISVINQRCIRNNTVNFSFCRLHNIQTKPVDKLIQIGDILVNSTGVGTLGRVAIVKWLENVKTTADSHVTIVRANKEQINPLFLGFSLLNKQTEIEKLGEGSTGQTELSRENLGKLKILLPKRELQNEFAIIAKPLFEKLAINEQQNRELSSLRDWLLPMLMNGQLKVTDDVVSYETEVSIGATSQKYRATTEPLNIPANKKSFAKQVLAGKIVARFIADPNFSDIKFQKVQFLAEHLIEADLNLNYYYQAAGPYDNKFMHTIYDDFRKQKWFDCENKHFIPMENQEKIEEYYQGYFASVQKQLETLFDILFRVTEAEAEIIATLYAVWNNRIIEARHTTDEELIADFYEWSDRKQRYEKSEILNGLKFLMNNNIKPRGFGQLTKRAKNKN